MQIKLVVVVGWFNECVSCQMIFQFYTVKSGNRVNQPSIQAFSSRSHDLARNFVLGDVTTFCTKSSRVSGRRPPGY